MSAMKCPVCRGAGGSFRGTTNYFDCDRCAGTGTIDPLAKAVPLAPRRAKGLGKDGRPLESAVQVGIFKAFDAIPYVQAWRNNTGKLPDENGRVVSYGLAVGSSDIIGIVTLSLVSCAAGTIGRFFALEVKRPGGKPTPDQIRFIEVVKRKGGAGTWVDNVADAVAFIERVRNGEE